MNLPQWQSHKKVWADKIRGITPDQQWLLECGGIVEDTSELTKRSSPAIGDYYVRYEDDYESWSPAKAFEAGYTKL